MLCGRALVGQGVIEGDAVVVNHRLSFLGEVDPKTGKLYDGRMIKDKVLVIRGVRGSTVGAYVIYGLRYYGNAPRAIVVMEEVDPIVLSGCVMANIPLVDKVGHLEVSDGERVSIEYKERRACLTLRGPT